MAKLWLSACLLTLFVFPRAVHAYCLAANFDLEDFGKRPKSARASSNPLAATDARFGELQRLIEQNFSALGAAEPLNISLIADVADVPVMLETLSQWRVQNTVERPIAQNREFLGFAAARGDAVEILSRLIGPQFVFDVWKIGNDDSNSDGVPSITFRVSRYSIEGRSDAY